MTVVRPVFHFSYEPEGTYHPHPCPNTGLSIQGIPVFLHFWGFPGTIIFEVPNRECSLSLCAGGRKDQYGWRSVVVAVIPCALVFRGVCRPVGHPFLGMKGLGWLMRGAPGAPGKRTL